MPVDFLATLDATGGSSGSAVLNARGELVGLLFDTMYEAIGSDLLYDASRGRSIQVDVRYLLWFLSEVAGATPLLEETIALDAAHERGARRLEDRLHHHPAHPPGAAGDPDPHAFSYPLMNAG